MRSPALALAFSVTVVLSVVAVASVMASSRQSPNPNPVDRSDRHEETTEADEAGVHGGSTARFHQAGACTLTSAAALPGNWTHGDYVSSVAVTGDSTLIVEAAHSDCGKPMVAVNHGGPPDHAFGAIEKHQSGRVPGS